MTDIREQAIRLYDAYTHEHLDRRRLLREMTALAGSAAAAETLILGIAASPAAAQITPANDPRLVIRREEGTLAGQPALAYNAMLKDRRKRFGTMVVVHENRGLNAHTEDVARQVALAGFNAVAPDFLAPQGGTPKDENAAREMIGKADYDRVIALAIAYLRRAPGGAGMVGFCWGGGLVNRVAVAAGPALAAGVSYYGPAPDPAEAAKVQAPLMIHLAGNDARVNKTAEPWIAALEAAGKRVEAHTYPGAEHAFNNDTSTERYNSQAATLAWKRTTAFLRRELDG